MSEAGYGAAESGGAEGGLDGWQCLNAWDEGQVTSVEAGDTGGRVLSPGL